MSALKRVVIGVGLATTLFLTPPAMGMDYREMKNEFQRYDAPLVYKQNMGGKHLKKNTEGQITDSELKIQEKALEALKLRWVKRVQETYKNTLFFNFETEESKKIRQISDPVELKKILIQEITLNTLISVSFERNPRLKAARFKWESVLEKYSQVTRLDNIMGQYQAFIKDLNTKVGPMRHKGMTKKIFPFPGMLTLKGNIVEKEIQIAGEKYIITLRDLITRIRETYDELIFMNEAISITSENLRLLKDLEEIASIKYSTGATGFNDVIKVQIEISKLANDVRILREQKKTIVAKLNENLNLSPDFSLGDPVKRDIRILDRTVKELYETGLKNQQELKVLTLRIEKTNLTITMAEKKFFPDFTQGFSYFENDKGNLVGTGKGGNAFTLKPVNNTPFWFGTNDAYVREARLRYQELQSKLTAAQNKLFLNVRKTYFSLDKSKRDILLYSKSLEGQPKKIIDTSLLEPGALLAQADMAIDVARREYEAGKIDFLNVLDAQRRFLNFSLNYVKAIKEYNQSYSRLERIVGSRIQN